jgi:hypothetical protein
VVIVRNLVHRLIGVLLLLDVTLIQDDLICLKLDLVLDDEIEMNDNLEK